MLDWEPTIGYQFERSQKSYVWKAITFYTLLVLDVFIKPNIWGDSKSIRTFLFKKVDKLNPNYYIIVPLITVKIYIRGYIFV